MNMDDKKLIKELVDSLQMLTGYAASMSVGCQGRLESIGAGLCADRERLGEQVQKAREVLKSVPSFRGLPVHKGYLMRYIRENTEEAHEIILGLGCKSSDGAIQKLEEFPGDWIINGQLVSNDDPDLPEHLRK